jgi:hypothetical protein
LNNNSLNRAENFLRDQISLYRTEPKLYKLLARAYAQQGKQALQHIALADEAAVQGAGVQPFISLKLQDSKKMPATTICRLLMPKSGSGGKCIKKSLRLKKTIKTYTVKFLELVQSGTIFAFYEVEKFVFFCCV